jgi:hypothetical protein
MARLKHHRVITELAGRTQPKRSHQTGGQITHQITEQIRAHQHIELTGLLHLFDTRKDNPKAD